MHSYHRTSRTTNTTKERHASSVPRTVRPEALLVSRERTRDSERVNSEYNEDVPEDSHENSDNPGTDIEAHFVDEEVSDLKRSSEDSTLLPHRPGVSTTREVEGESIHDASTHEPNEGVHKFRDHTKTDDATGELVIDPATAWDLVRPFRQKLSSTISGDRSRGSEYEQFALYLKALAHPTTKNPQSEQAIQVADIPPPPAVRVADADIPPPPARNHALPDYQMQLMLLEQQNKERLMKQRLATQREQHSTKMSMQQRQLPAKSSASDARHQGRHMDEDLIGSVADALGVPSESAFSLDTLKTYISNLQQHNRLGSPMKPDRYQIIHRTGSGGAQRLYLDRPQCTQGENTSQRAMVGNLPISKLASYLSKNLEICFIVFRDYDASSGNDSNASDNDSDFEPWPEHTAETVRLVRSSLTDTYNKFLSYSGFNTKEKAKDDSITLDAPYFAVYNKRQHGFKEFIDTLAEKHQSEFRLLVDYILDQYGSEWNEIARLIERGKVTPRYIKYLFKPGELVVQENEQGIRGYLATSWLEGPVAVTVTRLRHLRPNHHNSGGTQKRRDYTIGASFWAFDGSFSFGHAKLSFQLEHDDDRELDIRGLGLRPLTLSAPGVRERLRNRGLMFWKCRLRYFISYHEDPKRTAHHFGDDRYMIDTSMYEELRKRQAEPTNMKQQVSLTVGTDDLGHEFMQHDDPPNDEDVPGFLYMMPITIKGFNLKSKKWLDLKVDNIGEVVWNDEAFKSLVLKEETKDLIQALISNQIEAERSTDLISGKGNGLIMLLHGGPGTGKTLTAESVAEIARKPLYPVTCGDIGTEADHVEDYLESVLYIGRTWGCVVLMDEADVFLEERNLQDLQRNALVSVFLRVLEYYDGILVLTSNRVGHFDAAFKSRIQLAVRYPALDKDQRAHIWKSFILRLKTFNEGEINTSNLLDKIPELAENKLNGREIRNAITTGRQFVKWERQRRGTENSRLDYDMMQRIINIAGEFDRYLVDDLFEGVSLEQLAHDRLNH